MDAKAILGRSTRVFGGFHRSSLRRGLLGVHSLSLAGTRFGLLREGLVHAEPFSETPIQTCSATSHTSLGNSLFRSFCCDEIAETKAHYVDSVSWHVKSYLGRETKMDAEISED